MAKINVYQAWLGIPPDQQPPHHYRLLGIEAFEADPAVIERGADRQMTYLRSIKLGEHTELAEKLLSQISAAKLCLLDPQRKQQYDAQLRRKRASGEQPLKAAVPIPVMKAVPVPPASPPPTQVVAVASVAPALNPSRSTSSIARRRSNSNIVPLVVGGGILLLLLAGGAFLAATTDWNATEEVAEAPVPPREAQPTPPVAEVKTPATEPAPATSEKTVTPARLASASVDLPFTAGTIGSGQQVLSDRSYAFGKLDPQLEGLAFTKHPFGAPGTLKFQATAGGTLFLILPPRKYAEALPTNIKVPGWETTDLVCEMIVDGRAMPCVVLQLESARGASGQVPASPTVWPILAAKQVVSSQPVEVASNDPREDDEDVGEEADDASTESNDPPKLVIDDPLPGVDEEEPTTNRPTRPNTPVVRRQAPAAAAAAPLREKISEKFGVARLQSVDDKLSASRALVSMAESSTSSDEQYVALAVGAELAADAGEVTRALEVVAQLGEKFAGSTIDLELAAIRRFIAAPAPRAAKEQQLASLPAVIERAISAEKFAEVDDIVQDLLKSRLNSAVLGEQRKRAVALHDKYEKEVKPAMKALEDNPDDPEANRIVGDYLAVGLQQWPKALPLLAKGDDPLLARVAKSELANPQKAEDQLVVAQGWRSAVSERVGATERGPLMLHAEAWYSKAYAGLPERDRQRAREQLGKLQEDMDKMKWPSPPRQVTIYASCGEAFNLAINGKVVLSAIGPGVQTLKTTINQGDIILVQAQKSLPIREGGVATVGGGPVVVGGVEGGGTTTKRRVESYSQDPARRKGFACAIVYDGSTRHIATGAPGSPWRNYLTESAAAWENPKFVRAFDEVMVGGTTGGQQDLIAQSQTTVVSIWGGTSPFETYLFCRVP